MAFHEDRVDAKVLRHRQVPVGIIEKHRLVGIQVIAGEEELI